MANTTMQACEHHHMPSALGDAINLGSFVFNVVFLLEMGLKLLAYGMQGYWKVRTLGLGAGRAVSRPVRATAVVSCCPCRVARLVGWWLVAREVMPSDSCVGGFCLGLRFLKAPRWLAGRLG